MSEANYRYFKESEFACKCGCGENRIDPAFILVLDALRHDCGFPFHVNSGHRCEVHNIKVGGSDRSAHKECGDGLSHAADIMIDNSQDRFTFLKHAAKYFNRIGIAGTFIHIDNAILDAHAPDVVWMY